jgi:ATP-dependent RNA helicase DDX41
LLPALILAIQEELRFEIRRGEGPFALILAPSHELSMQTYETVKQFAEKLSEKGYPAIKSMLCIGGMDVRDSLDMGRDGVHIVVGK